MTAACGGCGRPVDRCPHASAAYCSGWVHRQDCTHLCAPGGAEHATPAPQEDRPVSVAGRDQPRPSPRNVTAHEVRQWRRTDEQFRADGFAFRLECGPHGWARLIEDGHRLEDVVRAGVMHEGGSS